MSETLRFVENELQIAALVFMASVYLARLAWLFRFRFRAERSAGEGVRSQAVGSSLLNVVRPGAMESSRRKPLFYLQFMIFHLGVAAAIAATFIIPYAPHVLANRAIVLALQIVCASAGLAGIVRLVRRLRSRALRAVSAPDDYAAIVLMILFFAAAVAAAPNRPDRSEAPLLAFFLLTAFFLVYVPFSKISHYLYYPFTRYFLGRMQGHRGVVARRGSSFRAVGGRSRPRGSGVP